jgi:hypothetical protein
MSYQHPDDLALVPELLALAPAEAKTFLAFNHRPSAPTARSRASTVS